MHPWRLESGASSGSKTKAERRPSAVDEETERDLVCATCRSRITHDDHRIAIAGAHEHTFVNPGGFVHHLGCFALAVNLSYVGAPETAFSWFPGYSWQIAACSTCATHLGWIYRCAGEQFHGLLLAQIIPGGRA